MKITIFLILCSSSSSIFFTNVVKAEKVKIDISKAIPRTEEPGFWNGRDINHIPMMKNYRNSGRIVGGQEVVPHTHPYQVGLFLSMGSSIFLCGGSLISYRTTLTAAHW
jgi:hypothetical protein